jgi:AcrR family transcriptional regulator
LSIPHARPLRADAQRNRELLLEVAVRDFSQDGPDVTLESIAAEVGVGIGTLYRHFPTRQALIEAAYRSELVRLCAGVPELLRTKSADVALRTWMDRFIDYRLHKSPHLSTRQYSRLVHRWVASIVSIELNRSTAR